jgi:hypothetical protein
MARKRHQKQAGPAGGTKQSQESIEEGDSQGTLT